MRYFFFAFLFYASLATAQPNYSVYNALLGKYVSSSGQVDYKNLKDHATELHAVTLYFSAQNPTEAWSRNERMAFWINAYNAFTIQLIVDNYPVESITKLDGGKPWDVKRINIGGKSYSLNQIENEILRPQFQDPRIHFAINCAAKSCPPLYNKAFEPKSLNQQLEQRTRAFVRTGSDKWSATTVKVSKVFDWYHGDFKNLNAFLQQYSGKTVSNSAKIEYLDYNWDLNQ